MVSVEERMKKVVSEIFHVPASKLSRKTEFIADLHAKSIDIVELIAGVEEEFDFQVIPAQVMQNKSIGDAVDWAEKKLKAQKKG